MSITITIRNNREYIDANAPELVEIDQDYLETAKEYGYPNPEECAKIYPFKMNLANGNFFALWNSLALEADYCGEIEADVLLKHLNLFSAKRLTCDDHKEGIMIDCGRSTEQVTRYFWNLSKIAKEAARRGETVTWC